VKGTTECVSDSVREGLILKCTQRNMLAFAFIPLKASLSQLADRPEAASLHCRAFSFPLPFPLYKLDPHSTQSSVHNQARLQVYFVLRKYIQDIIALHL
jgi:hypothetical protein